MASTSSAPARTAKAIIPRDVKKNVMTALIEMCCQDLHPFSIVNGEGFRRFCQVLIDNQSWTKYGLFAKDFLPNSVALEQIVSSQAEEIRNHLATNLCRHLIDFTLIAFTIDLWASNGSSESMICITLHYVDKNFKLFNRTLAVKSISNENWNPKGIKNEFTSVLTSYHLSDTGISPFIVTDGNPLLSDENGLLSIFQHLSCACHKIVTVMLKLFERQVVAVEDAGIRQSIYKYYDDIPVLFDTIEQCHDLTNYCLKHGITDQLGFVLKIPTEKSDWIALYEYFSSIEQNYDALAELLAQLEVAHVIEKLNRQVLQEFTNFIQLFHQATQQLKDPKQPTIHLVTIWRFRLLKHCRHILEEYNVEQEDGSSTIVPKDSLLIKSLKNLVQDLLLDHWSLDNYQLVATILDPRQKNLSRLEVSTTQTGSANILLQDLYIYQMKSPGSGNEHLQNRKGTKEREIDNFFVFSSDSDDAHEEGKISITEIQLYMETRLTKEVRSQGKNLDILKWWCDHRNRYPVLSRVARSVLAIPAYCTITDFKYNQLGSNSGDRFPNFNPQTISNMLMVRSNKDLAL